jgi:hypothetical protein
MAKDTYIPRNELVDINAEMNQHLEQVKAELMAIPGVVSVGLGMRQTKGEFLREICYVVTVAQKKALSEIPASQRIPSTMYGFPVDVRIVVQCDPAEDTKNYRPLLGGIQIQPKGTSWFGTLGCFATRNLDGKIVLLSNYHVLVNGGAGVGHHNEKIGQPSHNDCCTCCACNEIATVTAALLNASMDAGIALLHGQDADTVPDERYLREIREIGFTAGSAAALAGESVWKYGRTTNLTHGQVTNLAAATNTGYPDYGIPLGLARAAEIEITPMLPFIDYLLPGDSGSVSVNENNQVVGLNYSIRAAVHLSFANHIALVIAAPPAGMGITIFDATFHPGTGKEGVPLSSTSTAAFPSLTQAFGELETELVRYSEGRRIMGLFSNHREEMMGLVNTNREVMAAWNRYHGPEYLAHIARSLRREDKPVPQNIKGITLQSLLLKMSAVLQRNGSEQLSTAVRDNYLSVMGALDAGNSPEDWKAYLQAAEQDFNAIKS